MPMSPPVATILAMVIILTFGSHFASKWQNFPQHIQLNSNHHHLIFPGDKMAPRRIFAPHLVSLHNLNLRPIDLGDSNQFIIVPKCTKVANLVNFPKEVYQILHSETFWATQMDYCTHVQTVQKHVVPPVVTGDSSIGECGRLYIVSGKNGTTSILGITLTNRNI